MKRTTNGFVNTYELDEWYQRVEDKAYEDDNHRPLWLENDDSDDLIFNDALYGVI